MKAPIYNIDLNQFWINPYPDLKVIRNELPICFVPELGATLITKRQDIFNNEKKVEIFSSIQPDGLMQKLMGQNLMRKNQYNLDQQSIDPDLESPDFLL